jgi:hypothetical protein
LCVVRWMQKQRACCTRFDRPNCSGLFQRQQSIRPQIFVERASASRSESASKCSDIAAVSTRRELQLRLFVFHLSLLLFTTYRCVSSQQFVLNAGPSSWDIQISMTSLPDVMWLNSELSRAHCSRTSNAHNLVMERSNSAMVGCIPRVT